MFARNHLRWLSINLCAELWEANDQFPSSLTPPIDSEYTWSMYWSWTEPSWWAGCDGGRITSIRASQTARRQCWCCRGWQMGRENTSIVSPRTSTFLRLRLGSGEWMSVSMYTCSHKVKCGNENRNVQPSLQRASRKNSKNPLRQVRILLLSSHTTTPQKAAD